MPLRPVTMIALGGLLAATLSIGVQAAIVELQRRVECTTSLVRLSDVACIYEDDAQLLAALSETTLAAAPPAGQSAWLDVSEIADRLRRRAIDLARVEFAGASRVEVITRAPAGMAEPQPVRQPAGRPSTREERRARELVEAAIVAHLTARDASGGAADGIVLDFTLSDEAVRAVTAEGAQAVVWEAQRTEAAPGARFALPPPPAALPRPRADGGMEQQQLQLLVAGPQGVAAFPLDVRVRRPPLVLVAARDLARGEVIGEADAGLGPAERSFAFAPLTDLAEAIGRQTTRALRAGEPISGRDIESVRLVRRNEVVTVSLRGSGFTVRNLARATQDGALGETIALEPLESRTERFTGVVTGVREVQVPWE